jgi:hypothetical protein
MGDPNTETTVVYIVIYSTETVIILKAVLQGYQFVFIHYEKSTVFGNVSVMNGK